MALPRILKRHERHRLSVAQKALSKRLGDHLYPTKQQQRNVKPKTPTELSCLLNSFHKRRRFWLPSDKEVHYEQILISPNKEKTSSKIRNKYLEKRLRNNVGFALVRPPHGYESYLPDPQTIGLTFEELFQVAHQALNLKITQGGEFWRQFWDRASEGLDLVTVHELVDLLELKYRSGLRDKRILELFVKEIVYDCNKLGLQEIDRILYIFAKCNAHSLQLLELLTRRATQILDTIIEAYAHLSPPPKDFKGEAKAFFEWIVQGSDDKTPQYSLTVLASILESCFKLKFPTNANSQFLKSATNLLIFCRVPNDFPKLIRAWAALYMYQPLCTEEVLTRLVMRSQLTTAVLPERPSSVDSSLLSVFQNPYQLSDSVDIDIRHLSDFGRGMALTAANWKIAIQKDVREILCYNLASAIQIAIQKIKNTLSPVSAVMSQYPFSSAPRLLTIGNNGQVETRILNLTTVQSEFDVGNLQAAVLPEDNLDILRNQAIRDTRGGRRRKIRDSKSSYVGAKTNLRNRIQSDRFLKSSSFSCLRPPLAPLSFAAKKENFKRIFKLAASQQRKARGKSRKEKQEENDIETVIWDEENTNFKVKKDGKVSALREQGEDEQIKKVLSMREAVAKSQSPVASSDLAIFPSDERLKLISLFNDIVIPGISMIVAFWQKLAIKGSQHLLPDPSLDHNSFASLPKGTIRIGIEDNTEEAHHIRFMAFSEANPFELFILSVAETSVVKYGAFALDPEGLCLIFEALIYKAGQRRSLKWISNSQKHSTFAGGLEFSDVCLRSLEILCFESIRQWAAFSYSQKYRLLLSAGVVGLQNDYLLYLLESSRRSIRNALEKEAQKPKCQLPPKIKSRVLNAA